MSERRPLLGVDIGGSGIKGAPVDPDTGEFLAEQAEYATPEHSTPEAVAEVVREIAGCFPGTAGGPAGITFPGVVQNGVVRTAANVDRSWVGADAALLFSRVLDRPVRVLNDADAAALAEVHHGAARTASGVVLMTTLGTGIGTALVMDGHLVPNTEFGHLEIDGHDAETRASSWARNRDGLSYRGWATERLQRYYRVVEDLLWPDLIVVGGGVSRQAPEFLPYLELRTPVVAAELRNTSGIIGAVLAAG
ncbi:polyphosphate--glucose phosphotransferase [Nocardiopsis kunsanensis]|uniref:Polyphosphate glucokinase n=1 Tax=Nocardiopsis kunsanensis TaxID=141693 RepID=A0A918XAT5_9ACTN|nr:ROK family protein [Nocardiopsis kunsanensis]GHD20386.1 polyphosphate glucokinase [Nocardiopsis kunsanensis]